MTAKRDLYMDEVKVSLDTSERIRPLLAGLPPMVQGAALADLMSHWVIGHCPESRAEILATHYKAVVAMVKSVAGTRTDPWNADGTPKQ